MAFSVMVTMSEEAATDNSSVVQPQVLTVTGEGRTAEGAFRNAMSHLAKALSLAEDHDAVKGDVAES